MIDKRQVDHDFEQLISTDNDFAFAKARLSEVTKQEKNILSTQMLLSSQSRQGMKEAEAFGSSEYQVWAAKYGDAVYDYELLKNTRTVLVLRVELYRSELSARKMGMII